MKSLNIIIMLKLLVSIALAGGGMDSGGGDLKPAHYGSAWFLGTRAVKYCTKISEDFSVSSEKIDSIISEAFANWKNYYLTQSPFLSDLPQERISTHFVKMDICQKDTDLVFYFGLTTPSIERYLKNYTSPLAFAYKTDYYPQKKWSRGLIWVKNHINQEKNWDENGNQLSAIILHEIGHLFGNSHFPDSIMRDDIAELIIRGAFDHHIYAKRIGHRRELLSHLPARKDGFIDFFKNNSKEIFYKLTKKKAKGSPRASVEFDSKKLSKDDTFLGKLILEDENQKIELQLKIHSFSLSASSNDVFKVYYEEDSGSTTVSHSSPGSICYGTITDAQGVTYPIVVELNMDISTMSSYQHSDEINVSQPETAYPLQIFLLEKSEKRRIFGPGANPQAF